MVRVVICDVHSAIQTALANRIAAAEDLEVAATTAQAEELRDLVEQHQADVLVLELAQQTIYGLDVVRDLTSSFPYLRVLIYSMYDPRMYAERSIRAGASGYVEKTEPTDTVVAAIRALAGGEIYLDGSVASDVLRKLVGGTERQSKTAVLTDRELAVVQLIGEGHDVPSIADILGLSRKTIETYRRRAREKLGFTTNEELVSFAVQHHHV